MKTAKMPEYPKKYEKEFARFTTYMVESMGSQFKNESLNSLHVKTVEKFQDAKQVGNYAKVFLELSRKAKRKILKRFSTKRIEKYVDDLLRKVDSYNQAQTYKGFEKATGISSAQYIQNESVQQSINAYKLETQVWALKLRDDTLQAFTANTLRAMAEGEPMSEVIAGFDLTKSKRKDAAQFVARQQVTTFNSLASKARMLDAGITKAVWKTTQDERKRVCHQARHDKVFILSEGLYSSCDQKTLLPGLDFGCRCSSHAIFEEDEE